MSKINIFLKDKAIVLSALYNAAKPLNTSISDFSTRTMSIEEAHSLIEHSSSKYFDYIKGRILKIDFSKNCIDTVLYNRYNGEGLAEKVISSIPDKK